MELHGQLPVRTVRLQPERNRLHPRPFFAHTAVKARVAGITHGVIQLQPVAASAQMVRVQRNRCRIAGDIALPLIAQIPV
ncbi:hypothetical protein D3C80_1680830 [compost metagenome]